MPQISARNTSTNKIVIKPPAFQVTSAWFPCYILLLESHMNRLIKYECCHTFCSVTNWFSARLAARALPYSTIYLPDILAAHICCVLKIPIKRSTDEAIHAIKDADWLDWQVKAAVCNLKMNASSRRGKIAASGTAINAFWIMTSLTH